MGFVSNARALPPVPASACGRQGVSWARSTRRFDQNSPSSPSRHRRVDLVMNLTDARTALSEGRHAEGERICRSLLASRRGAWPTVLVLTDCLLAQEKRTSARDLTRHLLVRNPLQPDLLVARATVLAQDGQFADAVELLDRAVDLRLDHARGHELLAGLLEVLGDSRPRYEISVITSSVGTEFLRQAIESVQDQVYPFVRHIVVSDGPEYCAQIARMVPPKPKHPIHVIQLPFNVGANGFNGHRVYGAMPFLTQSRYVSFLDEDNWYEKDHLHTLMGLITSRGLAWGYSLRNIVSVDGDFITTDDCESLGDWPAWNDDGAHLVDVNCYLMRRDLAINASPLWYRRFRDQESPDFVLCRKLILEQPRHASSGRYTVNYRVGRSPGSVTAKFFLDGNKIMRRKHGGRYPWRELR